MVGSGFTKHQRLRNAHEFQAVFSESRFRVSCAEILVLARPNDLGYPRLGVITSKRNCRLATQRNRIKRVFRESFRLRQFILGIDIIILGRPGIINLPNPELFLLIDRLWDRLNQSIVDYSKKRSQ